MKIAVIGAGWAGCAAAFRAARSGHQVEVFEAARTLGGRARRLDVHGMALDNGQHILIGAYTDTLALLKALQIDESQAFLRIPLQLLKPDGTGLRASAKLGRFPRLAVAAAILGAKGWSVRDKLSLIATAARWEFQHFEAEASATVLDVCKGMRPAVLRDLIEPLCVSALNTPAARSSGKVFLRVMHDALFAEAGGSDYLLPKRDLSALLPDAAMKEVQALGGKLHLGVRVQGIHAMEVGRWMVKVSGETKSAFDAVILATPSSEAARLAQPIAPQWASVAEALRFESIATVYLQTSPPQALPSPILALPSSAAAPAQFAFDRSQLGGKPGLWALVVSASNGSASEIEAAVAQQARAQLGAGSNLPFRPKEVLTVRPELVEGLERASTSSARTESQLNRAESIAVIQTVVEKRATFACEPGTVRPPSLIAPGLVAVGDYIAGPYPATLEGAVRSVRQAWPLIDAQVTTGASQASSPSPPSA